MAMVEKLRFGAADSFTDKRFHLLGCLALIFLGLLFNHEFTNQSARSKNTLLRTRSGGLGLNASHKLRPHTVEAMTVFLS